VTEEHNLWLACSPCTSHKADRVAANDPETGEIVRLFHPREQRWQDHFEWTPEFDRVIGSTATGAHGACGSSPAGTRHLNVSEHARSRTKRQSALTH
jgi:hypothetical protein